MSKEDKTEWLNERRKGIGGSDAAAICGVSPYRTPLQVWEDKRGLSGVMPDNDAMLWGRILEPAVRQRYADVTGRAVRVPEGILQHPQFNFMLANIDGFTDDKRGVEVKTAASPKEWGDPGTDEIPLLYIFQVQHYMTITGFAVFDVPVLIGGRDFRIYEVPADNELQEMLVEKEAAFWKMVQEATPPEPVNYEDVLRRFRQSKAETITATGGIVDSVNQLRHVREELKKIEADEEALKTYILGQMKEADTLIDVDGSVLATWKSNKPVNRVDLKALQKDLPDIYSKYLKPGEASRRFLLKGERA
jgi:putative phage-type endonuclease